MHRYDLISCHDCATLHRKRALFPRQMARCTRCRAILYRGTSSDLNRMVALALGTLLVFLIAQCCTIVDLEVNGLHSSATLFGAIAVLWWERMQVVAAMVFLFTMLFPLVEIGGLLYVTLCLRAGFKPPGFHRLLRAIQAARRWGMTEVLMIGILITLVKMMGTAVVSPQPGLFAFGALTLMLAVLMAFDPQSLWDIGDRLLRPPLPPIDYRALTSAALLACHACGLVNMERQGVRRQRCARCACVLHRRRPDSVRRTWALLLAAAILYVPANLLPVMYSNTLLGGDQEDTILSGVVYFWTSGSPALATIIFIASIVVPILKLGALSLLACSAQRGRGWRAQQHTRLYRVVELIGRWSMLDIFVVTLTVALVRFQSVALITAGPGALAFGSVVVLTMLASMQFDPRLIWDNIRTPETHGEPHA